MHNETIIEKARFLQSVMKRLRMRLMVKHHAIHGFLDGPGSDLTMPQFTALMVVREHKSLSLKELAKAMQVSSPSASSMVDRLVEMGMLKRQQNESDRREIRLHLSKIGNEAVKSLENHFLSTLVELLERLGPEVSENWCEIYENVERVINELEAREQEPLNREGVQ